MAADRPRLPTKHPVPSPGIGVMLPSFDAHGTGRFPVAEAARHAEALGFDSVWVGDHVSFHPPVMDCVVALSAAAAVTERVALGTGVLLGALRPPALVATAFAGLDRLSNGRVILGLGVGGENPAEYQAVDVPVNERGARLDDLIDALPQLWSGEATTFRGRRIRLDVPPLRPTPVQQPGPPIWIGGRSAIAIRRAALRGAGWLPVWISPARLSESIAQLRDQAAAAGRPAPGVTLMLFATVGPDAARCRAEAAAQVRGQYQLELDAVERWCVLGDPAGLRTTVEAARDAGVTGFILHGGSPDWRSQYDYWAAALDLRR